MNSVAATGDTVVITIELFGMARISAGVSSLDLAIDTHTRMDAMLGILAQECPALVGSALRVADDGNAAVADGYALNRNGLAFLPPDADSTLRWSSGDSLLLLSNQAGG